MAYTKLHQYHKVTVKQSHYRKLRFPDFTTTAQEGGKIVSLTHRPHLPPGNSPGTHFFRGWVDPRAKVWSEGLCQWKIPNINIIQFRNTRMSEDPPPLKISIWTTTINCNYRNISTLELLDIWNVRRAWAAICTPLNNKYTKYFEVCLRTANHRSIHFKCFCTQQSREFGCPLVHTCRSHHLPPNIYISANSRKANTRSPFDPPLVSTSFCRWLLTYPNTPSLASTPLPQLPAEAEMCDGQKTHTTMTTISTETRRRNERRREM